MNKIAIFQGNVRLTYQQLFSNATKISHHLKHLTNQRIGLLSPSSSEYVSAMLGIWKSKNSVVPMNPAHPLNELKYYILDSKCSYVLIHPSCDSADLSKYLNSIDIPFQTISNKILDADMDYTNNSVSYPINIFNNDNPNDPALFIYTSGTTGKPKGVVHSFKSLESQVKSLCEAWEWSSDDKILHTLPLHHIHGIVNALLCALYSNASIEFLPFINDGKYKTFNPATVWEKFNSENNLTIFMGVPAMYSSLLNEYKNSMSDDMKRLSRRNLSTWGINRFRLFVSGSSPLPMNLFDEWFNMLTQDHTELGSLSDPLSLRQRSTILERYGMSEIGMALSNPLRGQRIRGTVGSSLPGVQTKIAEETGELYVQGDNLFSEYWNKPEATKEAFDQDGWFKTGDIVSKKYIDGKEYVSIMGRNSTDILKVSGYKISALDIENEIVNNENVNSACVFGIPGKDGGDQIVALVIPSSKIELDTEQLKVWLRDRTAHYKVPSKIIQVEQIPVNAMGKVNKKELRKQFS